MKLFTFKSASEVDIPTFISGEEREIYRVYDQQRRLRLARNIAGFLAILIGMLTVGEILADLATRLLFTDPSLALMLIGADTLVTCMVALGFVAARHQRVNLATTIVSGVTVLATCFFSVSENLLEHQNHANTLLGFFSLNLGIVLVGLLGNLWVIIATTVFINCYTMLAMFVIIPSVTGQHPADAFPNFPSLLVILFVQWALAALMIAAWFNYQQTFRDLGDAHVAVDRAKKLDDLKDQFISSVNHELRNPVMAMMNYTMALKLRHEALAPAQRNEIILALEQTGRRITKLIGSILDARRLEQHPDDFQPQAVPLLYVLKTAAELVDPADAQMVSRDIRVTVPADVVLWGDDVYLQQIFTNLLSNAVKYSPPGSPIEVSAHQVDAAHAPKGLMASRQSLVEITIRDYGLGIPPDQIPLLFNRFVRLPRDLASKTLGNGLGLYLCKVLTEAMGGRIWVESSGIEGEGSTFHLLLPVVDTAQQV